VQRQAGKGKAIPINIEEKHLLEEGRAMTFDSGERCVGEEGLSGFTTQLEGRGKRVFPRRRHHVGEGKRDVFALGEHARKGGG